MSVGMVLAMTGKGCFGATVGKNVLELPPLKIPPQETEYGKELWQRIRLNMQTQRYRCTLSLMAKNRKMASGTLETNGRSTNLHLQSNEQGSVPLSFISLPNGTGFIQRDNQRPQTIEPSMWFSPLLPETALCPFCFLFMALDWKDLQSEGFRRKRGRPAQQIRLFPPVDIQRCLPRLHFVQIILDTSFETLLQMEVYDRNGNLLAATRILGFKKIGPGDWRAKELEVEYGPVVNRLIVENFVPIEN